jgi:hypothetical protein
MFTRVKAVGGIGLLVALLAACTSAEPSTTTSTPMSSTAPASYSGPDEILARLKAAGLECIPAAPARVTKEGGFSQVCAVAEDALIVSTYPSKEVLADSLKKSIGHPGQPVDALIGENWTIACGSAKTASCSALKDAVGGQIAQL